MDIDRPLFIKAFALVISVSFVRGIVVLNLPLRIMPEMVENGVVRKKNYIAKQVSQSGTPNEKKLAKYLKYHFLLS